MKRRTLIAASGGTLVGLSLPGGVKAQAGPRRIGLLTGFNRAAVDAFLGDLRPELEKLGWIEGRDYVMLEPRTAEGANDRLPAIADELVSQAPHMILVSSIPATRALAKATKTVPVVMAGVGTPVELGIVADYRKPGGNITGSSYLADELIRKSLQFLKEAAPRLRSVALFTNPSNEAAIALTKQMHADATALGMQAKIVEVVATSDFGSAFAVIRSANTESILLPPEPLIQANREAIAAFAKVQGVPLAVVGPSRVLPTTGLFAYGPAPLEYARLTAKFVDRIFRGARPADLPIEQPTKFELRINLKTAKTLGITVPQTLLLRADEVIQ